MGVWLSVLIIVLAGGAVAALSWLFIADQGWQASRRHARRKAQLRYPPAVQRAKQLERVTRIPVASRVRVAADRRPLWQIRGWRRDGKSLVGAYRTRRGSFAGVIEVDRSLSALNFYIINPPPALVKGSHGACFRSRGGGRYWIHFSRPERDPDSGIVAVEALLVAALSA